MERDANLDEIVGNFTNFNSHAHVERDYLAKHTADYRSISTHTLTWSVTLALPPRSADKGYFNSHAHVERDNYRRRVCQYTKISTHTLTWSVTGEALKHIVVPKISTHTLTWSVTEFVCKKCHDNFISTHTLTWSVTLSATRSDVCFIFQLTRSRGA